MAGRVLRVEVAGAGAGAGAGKHKSPNLTLNYQKIKGNLIMFQRRFAILFLFLVRQVITRKPSYLKLTKGDTKEKDTKERST